MLPPLPAPNPDTQEFWDGCRRHELRIQRCADCGAYEPHPPRWCDAIACGIEDGAHAIFELARTGHTNHERRSSSTAPAIREFEQVARILVRLCAGGEDAIVAGQLPLDP